ncbi:PilZ domain-containing protein [Bradyrhizobium sp. AUGA SZCCT0177]|uniref:PilZ domain-containing protein n=1 Tax=Bradyrhizobium sp. AUGA SZCCT0182 TaxID=2807667 RepID=UPI001BABA424|nr:PilZ domain-containing protein [Bradyrhizobium sp. AUGA SZCCT0182]MBR1280434.1 PilZ domain-containing protein [Bradyrhizobium sp. AUGA SZCCT0177]
MPTIAIADTEARNAPRRKVLDSGLMRFGDLSVPCVIRNLSEIGAALDAVPQSLVPDQFTLIVVRKKKIYSCTVIWRKGTRLGVSFC